MRRWIEGALAVCFLAGAFLVGGAFHPSPASAMGVGLSLGGSSGTATVGNWFWGGGDDARFHRGGVGFLFDTALPGRVFGYRLEVCAENVEVEPTPANPGMDIDRFSIQHTFGFAVFRGPGARVWLGPQAMIYRDRDPSLTPGYSSEGWGIGGVMGADFRVAPSLSLGITSGGRTLWGDGTPDISYDEFFFTMNLVFHFGER